MLLSVGTGGTGPTAPVGSGSGSAPREKCHVRPNVTFSVAWPGTEQLQNKESEMKKLEKGNYFGPKPGNQDKQ